MQKTLFDERGFTMLGKKSLKAFMREEARTHETVTAPAPPSFPPDEDGNPVMLEIKVLHSNEIQKINDAYRKRAVALDKRGNPIVQNGEIVFKTERDNIKASNHILVEALVYPDLKDKELMEFFECVDITEMPGKVFPRPEEIGHVSRVVMSALGLGNDFNPNEDEETLEEIKN